MKVMILLHCKHKEGNALVADKLEVREVFNNSFFLSDSDIAENQSLEDYVSLPYGLIYPWSSLSDFKLDSVTISICISKG